MTHADILIASQHHLALCDAVLAGDGPAARTVMTAHLAYTHEHIFRRRNQLHEPIQVNVG